MARARKTKQPRIEVATPEIAASGDIKNVAWAPQPGPQTTVLLCNAYEILYGGSKGSGKTELGRGWLLKGNTRDLWEDPDNPTPADVSYINHHDYRAVITRRNLIDMREWILKAKRLYCDALGAEFREKDNEFVWPSGARFAVSHLADESAFFKYEGNEITRWLVEELTHIPTYDLYKNVKKNIRSTVRGLRAQVLCTTNPPGPGMMWVKERFIEPFPEGNRLIEQREFNEYTNQEDVVTRIYVPARLTDNKLLLEQDPGYITRLKADLGSDEDIRAYLYGDWDALAGGYFKSFRRDKHIVPEGSIELKPWYHRWVSLDWGYRHKTVVYWFCQIPTGQIVVYKEKVLSETTPDEAGELVALDCLDDLKNLPGMSMTIFAPPEFIGRRNEASASGQTFGQMFAEGVGRVVGASSSVLLEDKEATENFFARQSLQRDASLVVRGGFNKRVEGWQYMRALMRTEYLPTEKPPEIDMAFATELMRQNRQTDYDNYMETVRRFKPVVLPKLLITDNVTLLPKAIPTAVYDDDGEDVRKVNTDADDALDSCRMGCAAHKFQLNEEPYQEFLHRRLNAIREKYGELTGNALVFANRKAEQDWEDRNGASGGVITFNRAWSRQTAPDDMGSDDVPLTRFLQ